MSAKTKNILSLIINLVVVAVTAYSMSFFFRSMGSGNMQVAGAASFKYFTNLSNYFIAFTALATIPCNIKNIKTGGMLPKGLYMAKFMATVAVTVTFLTCVFFLAPINILILSPYGVPPLRAYLFMFAGNTFFLHFLTPVLAIIVTLLLDRTDEFRKKDHLLGVLPVLLYAIVYGVMVAVVGAGNGGWQDFYHFTFGGKMYMIPVSAAVMLFATWLISRVEWKIYTGKGKKTDRN